MGVVTSMPLAGAAVVRPWPGASPTTTGGVRSCSRPRRCSSSAARLRSRARLPDVAGRPSAGRDRDWGLLHADPPALSGRDRAGTRTGSTGVLQPARRDLGQSSHPTSWAMGWRRTPPGAGCWASEPCPAFFWSWEWRCCRRRRDGSPDMGMSTGHEWRCAGCGDTRPMSKPKWPNCGPISPPMCRTSRIVASVMRRRGCR